MIFSPRPLNMCYLFLSLSLCFSLQISINLYLSISRSLSQSSLFCDLGICVQYSSVLYRFHPTSLVSFPSSLISTLSNILQVTVTGKYLSLPGYSPAALLREAQIVSLMLPQWGKPSSPSSTILAPSTLPAEGPLAALASLLSRVGGEEGGEGGKGEAWATLCASVRAQFMAGAYERYVRWASGRYTRVRSRAGILVDLVSKEFTALCLLYRSLCSQCLLMRLFMASHKRATMYPWHFLESVLR